MAIDKLFNKEIKIMLKQNINNKYFLEYYNIA